MTIIEHFDQLLFQIKEVFSSRDFNDKTFHSRNKKKQNLSFYKITEQIIINYLLKEFPNSKIWSEEVGLLNESLKQCKYTFIVNSLDGYINFSSHIPFYGFSIAVLEGKIIASDLVTHAIIGHLPLGNKLTAEKGKGAFFDKKPIKQNLKANFNGIISCNFSHFNNKNHHFKKLSNNFNHIRSFGCSTIELSYVIQGILSAHYDFRDRTIPKYFLSPSLILKEMGGLLTNLNGDSINNIDNLMKGYSFIASHNKNEHDKFLNLLH